MLSDRPDGLTVRFDGVTKRYTGVKPGSLRRAVDHLFHRSLGPNTPVTALNDVSFDVFQGERLGIIGGNGAGKSTAMSLVAGITPPTKGSVTVRGRVAPLLEVGAGFHDDLTGRENVYLNGIIMGMSRRDISARFDDIIAFAELEEFVDTPVKYYSSGMYMRLGFAVAAHLEPDVLLIDEVLAVGDAAFQQKSLARMREIAQSGATVVFISHNIPSVQLLCNRGIYLLHGEIVAEGPVSDVVERYMEDVRAGVASLHHDPVGPPDDAAATDS